MSHYKLILLLLFQFIIFSNCKIIFKSYTDDKDDRAIPNEKPNIDKRAIFSPSGEDTHKSALDILKSKGISIYEKSQKLVMGDNLDCMPGSLFYNRSCYYFSHNREKVTWLHAHKFCRILPLNSSLLVIKNNDELEFIKQQIIRLKQNENFQEQLVYYIGFNYTIGEWKWLNNQSLISRNYSNSSMDVRKYWNETSKYQLGKCGSIVVLEDNQVVLRSAPCSRTDERFICTYLLNPCYKNNVCGDNGRCVNLLSKVYCECTMFYQGKYCDKMNSRAIQTIAAIVMIAVALLYLAIKHRYTKKIYKFLKKNFKELFSILRYSFCMANDVGNDNLVDSKKKQDNDATKKIKLNNRTVIKEIERKKKVTKTLSKTFTNHFRKHLKFYDQFILILMIILLTIVQVFLIHLFKQTFRTSIRTYRKIDGSPIKFMCDAFESRYLSEEIIFLPCGLLLISLLFVVNSRSRFSNYIIDIYERHMSCSFYKEIIEKRRLAIKEQEEERLKTLSGCRRCCFKTKRNWFYKALCCICCCSCCMNEEAASGHGCMYDTCCKPIMNTECCKSIACIKKVFSYICCCKLICCVRRKIIKSSQIQNESVNASKRNSSADEAASNMTETLKKDPEFYGNLRKTIKWPLPVKPFSTTNRLQSVAVYVAYTYDVLTIFLNLYTSYMEAPITIESGGVLYQLIIQLLTVLLIGFKFYPILAIADMPKRISIYVFGFAYVMIITFVKVVNKSFCRRDEAFLKYAISSVYNQIENNRFLGLRNSSLISRTDDGNVRYRDMLKEKIPNLFDKYIRNRTLYQSLTSSSNDAFYAKFTIQPDNIITSTLSSLTTSKMGYRKKLLNKTHSYTENLIESYFDDDKAQEWTKTMRDLIENLPLYISLSYLVCRYLLTLLELSVSHCLKPWMKKMFNCCKTTKQMDPIDKKSFNVLFKKIQKSSNLDENSYKQIRLNNYKANLSNPIYNLPKERPRNTNYLYIKAILKKAFPLIVNKHRLEQQLRSKPLMSYTMHIAHKIYKPKKYYKFSNQFINTYTVAFMIVFIFTALLLRISSLFGNKLISYMNIIYQFLIRSLNSDLNLPKFENHNLYTEFVVTCLLTAFILSYQLCLSIINFKNYVLYLRQCKTGNSKTYINLWKNKKARTSSMITSQSLHFPGYLIAHLVYGYVVLFLVMLTMVMVIKFFIVFPTVITMSTQLFLPFIILLVFKIVSIKVLTRSLFIKDDEHQRITNLTPYYMLMYFNFFFDCFLGLAACLNRVWQTTVVSMFFLPRLDISMFNEQNQLLLEQLDKGHLSYINFAHMECMYNNHILNGFCEILIEILFESNMNKCELTNCALSTQIQPQDVNKAEAKSLTETPNKKRSYLIQPSNKLINMPITSVVVDSDDDQELIKTVNNKEEKPKCTRSLNPNFNYKSYRRLCNIFNYYLILRKHVSQKSDLSDYTIKNIKENKILTELNDEEKQYETFVETVKRNINEMRSPSPSPRTRRRKQAGKVVDQDGQQVFVISFQEPQASTIYVEPDDDENEDDENKKIHDEDEEDGGDVDEDEYGEVKKRIRKSLDDLNETGRLPSP